MTVREALVIVFKELGDTDEEMKERMLFADKMAPFGAGAGYSEIKPGQERSFIEAMKKMNRFTETPQGRKAVLEGIARGNAQALQKAVKN